MKEEKLKIQENEYNFPYHYLDFFKIHKYKIFIRTEYLSRLNAVINLLEKGEKILDVGCGDGRFCYEAKKNNFDISGIDISENAIRFAKAYNPNLNIIAGDIRQFKYGVKFDSIVLIETLEHFPLEEIDSILVGISNNLKKNGRLIVTVPSVNQSLIKKHYQHFTEETLNKTLKNYFSVINVIGHLNNGPKYKIYKLLKNIAVILLPFREKNFIGRSFFNFFENFYKKNIEFGKPNQCRGLIGVYKKL